MNPFSKLPLFDPESGVLVVLIETPKGGRNKFDWDEKLELFSLTGVLMARFGVATPEKVSPARTEKNDSNVS